MRGLGKGIFEELSICSLAERLLDEGEVRTIFGVAEFKYEA
jgi:hypothetical protein